MPKAIAPPAVLLLRTLVFAALITLAGCASGGNANRPDRSAGADANPTSTPTKPTQKQEAKQGTKQGASRDGASGAAPSEKATKQSNSASGSPTRNQIRRTAVASPGGASVCPPQDKVLAGVYHPERLKVLDPCKKASGTVVEVRHEEDGDLHVNVRPDPAYENLLISGNYSGEGGNLVVEMMARDGGHLPEPKPGQHLLLIGAYVNDLQHDWAEIHPVWGVSIDGGPVSTSGPRYGGSPDEARSYNAEGECRTNTGAACKGYGSGSYSEDSSGGQQPKSPPPPSPSSSPPAPAGKDYNCSDFGTQAQAQKYLLPGDPYRLDANHDGTACDSLP